jgi:hypothetical protein
MPYRRGAVRKDNGGRSTAAYRRYRAQVLSDPFLTNCCICGGWVDKSLPYRDPVTGKVNPGSPSLEHLVPLCKGGGLFGPAGLSHLSCNQRGGARMSGNASREAALLRDPARHF